jgi:hypothetical protein
VFTQYGGGNAGQYIAPGGHVLWGEADRAAILNGPLSVDRGSYQVVPNWVQYSPTYAAALAEGTLLFISNNPVI